MTKKKYMNLYTEQEIINMIIKKFKGGIGDDAAVIDPTKDEQMLVSCDSQVEGVHFEKEWMSASQIGKRAVLVAVSDIAAMGGVAKYILVSLMLPVNCHSELVSESKSENSYQKIENSNRNRKKENRRNKYLLSNFHNYFPISNNQFRNGRKQSIDQLFNGIEKACKMYNTQLIGGNLSSSKQIVIDVTVLGYASKGHIIHRFGAKPGDLLMVTGTVGDAAAGRFLLQHRYSPHSHAEFISASQRPKENRSRNKFGMTMECVQDDNYKARGDRESIINRFILPTPRLKEGVLIAKYATAMIDISDGLVVDVLKLCNASGVGVRLFEDAIPISVALQNTMLQRHPELVSGSRNTRLHLPMQSIGGQEFGMTMENLALYGGEDYELCFTVNAKDAKKITTRVKRETGTTVIVIGEIVEKQKGLVLINKDGSTKSLREGGWDHFRD